MTLWTVFRKRNQKKILRTPQQLKDTRSILFPTRIVELTKNTETGEVFEFSNLNLLDYEIIKHKIEDLKSESHDGASKNGFATDNCYINVYIEKNLVIYSKLHIFAHPKGTVC